MTTNIETLLSQVETLIKKNNEILDATGSRFNIFEIAGVNHNENTHSAILAEFLNPKGSHALGKQFLESFMKTVGLQGFLEAEHARVITEMWGGQNGRMDIVIESCGKAVIIENKIYACDQREQLQRYQSYANKKYKGHFKILYLTLYGDQATENSGKGVEYSQISYKLDIVAWLQQCVMLAANYPFVRETLNQYINQIKKLTNSSIHNKMSKEITNFILATPERFNSAFELATGLNQAKTALQQRFWHTLATACKQSNLNIDNEQEFLSQIDGWVEKYYAQSRNNKNYGISIIVGELPTGELVRYDIMVQNNIFMGFVFELGGKTDISANYEQHRKDLKEYDDTFTPSQHFIGWQHTEPKLNFSYFDTPATRKIACENEMNDVIASIVKKVKEDIEFARSKFQVK